MANNRFDFEIINLGNSEPVELRYLISLIEKELNKEAKISWLPESPGDPKITCADITKAKNMLNYVPRIKIEKGINLFVKWYKQTNEKSRSISKG